jgi:hypothetical protein
MARSGPPACPDDDGSIVATSDAGPAVSEVARPMLVMTLSLTPHALTETAATATTMESVKGVRERHCRPVGPLVGPTAYRTISNVPAAVGHPLRRAPYLIVAASSPDRAAS